MTKNEALEIVLDLAREKVIDELNIDEYDRQIEALYIVEDILENKDE